MQVGKKLNQLRKERQFTLKQLAEATGLSAAYLSKIENDHSSPTLENMQKICEVLQVTLAEFVTVDKKADFQRLLKMGDRPKIYTTGSGVVYRLLYNQSPKIKIICSTIQADNYKEETSWGHHDIELGLVAEGSMVVSFENDENVVITPGDLICIMPHEVHRYKKVGEDPCTVYWIYVPEHDLH